MYVQVKKVSIGKWIIYDLSRSAFFKVTAIGFLRFRRMLKNGKNIIGINDTAFMSVQKNSMNFPLVP